MEVLAYFNNDWEVFAVRNALRLKAMLDPLIGREPLGAAPKLR